MNPQERACAREKGPACWYLVGYTSFWCTNRACCQDRGTDIPGVVNCSYYESEESRWKILLVNLGYGMLLCLSLTLLFYGLFFGGVWICS